jgi:predicted secreted protein
MTPIPQQIPQQVQLHVGESLTVELPGLGTAGFIWQDQVAGSPGVIQVSWSRGFAPGTEPTAIGVSAPEVATIQAVGPGEVTLRLVQVQPWEPQAAPNSQHLVAVRVVAAG